MKSDEEIQQEGLALKDEGNAKFKGQDYKEASRIYKEALATLSKVKNE